MKQILMKNFGLKLISLLLAIISWIVIINIQDPIEKGKFTDIPVQIINEEMVQEKDKIPVTIEGDKVDVVVEARRSILDNLSQKDFKAVADFSKISFMDAVPIEISLPQYSEEEVSIIRGNDQVLKLILDDYVKKSFNFEIRMQGEAAEGFIAGDAIVSPNVIQISGAATVVSKVKEVVLDIVLKEDYSDFVAEARPKVYDMNGDLMDTSELELSVDEVTVNVPILHTKTIKLKVVPVGTLLENHEIMETLIAPETVTIAGAQADLAKISQLYRLEIDVAGLSGRVERNIAIEKVLQEKSPNVQVVGDVSAAVTIDIQPYETWTYTVPEDSIRFINVPSGCEVEIVSMKQSEVYITGPQSRLKDITIETINPYINVENRSKETIHRMELKLRLPSSVKQVGEVYVDVIIKNINQ